MLKSSGVSPSAVEGSNWPTGASLPTPRKGEEKHTTAEEERERRLAITQRQVIAKLTHGAKWNPTVPKGATITGAGKGRKGDWPLKRQFREAEDSCASCGGWIHAFGEVLAPKATKENPRPHAPTLCASCQEDGPHVEETPPAIIVGMAHAVGGGRMVEVGTHAPPVVRMPDSSAEVRDWPPRAPFYPIAAEKPKSPVAVKVKMAPAVRARKIKAISIMSVKDRVGVSQIEAARERKASQGIILCDAEKAPIRNIVAF